MEPRASLQVSERRAAHFREMYHRRREGLNWDHGKQARYIAVIKKARKIAHARPRACNGK